MALNYITFNQDHSYLAVGTRQPAACLIRLVFSAYMPTRYYGWHPNLLDRPFCPRLPDAAYRKWLFR